MLFCAHPVCLGTYRYAPECARWVTHAVVDTGVCCDRCSVARV
jgi:hypothetical protein